MNTPDTEWEERLMDEFCVMFERATRSGEEGTEWVEKMESFITQLLSSRDTYWKERVRKEVEGLWHDLGKYQGWLGGVMGSEVDSTLMLQPPTKEVRETKALHTAIIMKAKEKVHQMQIKVKSSLDNLKSV